MIKQTQNSATEHFEVVVEAEEDGTFHIFAPALKGCHSCGATREEALINIAEAIELWLQSAEELGIPIPQRHTVTIKAR